MTFPAQSLIKGNLHTHVTTPHASFNASERCGHTQFLPVKHSRKHLKAQNYEEQPPSGSNFHIFMMEKEIIIFKNGISKYAN